MNDPDPTFRGTRLATLGKLRGAFVQISGKPIIVVEVEPDLLDDPFEAQVVITAVALLAREMVVLAAVHPCGCRELYGPVDVTAQLHGLPDETFVFHELPFDFSPPTRSPRRRRPSRAN